MTFTQIVGMVQPISLDDVRKIFERLRNRINATMIAVRAFEDDRMSNRAERLPDRITAIAKTVENMEWASLGLVADFLPIQSRSQFADFRRVYTEAISQLSELSTCGDGPDTSAILEKLKSVQSQVDRFEADSVGVITFRRWAALAVAFVIVVAGPTFLFTQYWAGDIEPDSFTLQFPNSDVPNSVVEASNLAQNQYAFSVPDRDAFMLNFSRFYFGHPNNFLDQYFEQLPPRKRPSSEISHSNYNSDPLAAVPAPAPPDEVTHQSKDISTKPLRELDTTVANLGSAEDSETRKKSVTHPIDSQTMRKEYSYRWKLLLKNTSLRSPRFVSSVRETIELVKEEKFPWSELRYAPKLKLSAELKYGITSPPYLSIANEGLGPAIGVAWTVNAKEKLVVSAGTQFMITGRRIGEMPLIDENWGYIRIRKGGGNRGERVIDDFPSVYAIISQIPKDVPEADIESATNPCLSVARDASYVRLGELNLKRVRLLSELVELTDVTHQVHVGGSYEDMKGDKHRITETLELPPDIRIFRWNDKLFKPALCAAPAAAANLFYALVNTYAPLPAKTPERDALVATFDLDLSNLIPGASVTESTQFDSNLAPLGHIVVFTTGRCIRSGVYEVRIDVNGKQEMKFRIRTLNPEIRKFPVRGRIERLIELHWFRAEIGSESYSAALSEMKDSLSVSPLDDVPGSPWQINERESPFDPSGPRAGESAPEPAPAP